MPKIYDNIDNQLSTALNDTLALSERADFCVGYFNLRGWKEVAASIEQLSGATIIEGETSVKRVCRLLVGMQKAPQEILREYYSLPHEHLIDHSTANKLKKKIAQEFKDQLTIGVPTEADEKALRQLSKQLKEKKVVVKLYLLHPLHAKLYLAFSKDTRVPILGYLGSSNLTLAGLAGQGELNIDVLEQDAAQKLAHWFNDRWLDRLCIDITAELIEIIDNSWAADRLVSPYHIYLKIAYHLSHEARAGMSEFKLPKVFEKDLLEFQQKAVLVAAHHLNKRGGVLIGDVVGLGKTITAVALAKMFEEDFSFETLIICPKNLVRMWKDYSHKYELRAHVISQSNIQKELKELRRYRLVIIDESHNLRNDEGKRYRAIKSYLEKNESKVILLSATPYNKTYLDLANQLRLFIADDKDLGISPETYIKKLGGLVEFNAAHTETFSKSIKAFAKSNEADDWRELMRLYLVRRTRSFIKTHYAESDPKDGRKYLSFADGRKSYFPERKARKVLYTFKPNDPDDTYAQLYSPKVLDIINHLELPRYGLQNYLDPKPVIKANAEEEKLILSLSHAGKRLMGFCRTNLFKRLESSGYSFLLSLSRHILRNYVFIYALQNKLSLPIGKNITHNLDDFLEDDDSDNEEGQNNALGFILDEKIYLERAAQVYNFYTQGSAKNNFDLIHSEFFSPSLEKNLIEDCRNIIKILKIGKAWEPVSDKQLNALHEILTVTHQKEKVIVFTQFADTARYLTEQLKKRGLDKLECVTGDNDQPTELACRFSPRSNGRTDISGQASELRVLIATDVLSEGQNLQDAHIILNYDLPWAIIRLIQRAGRVDRIGQTAPEILCYSFLPEDGIEAIINLRRRLTMRISENANVVGSDETFFDGDPINIEDLYNEKANIMDDDEDDEVDLASTAYQIWKDATDADPSLKNIIPNLNHVIYATKENKSDVPDEGIILYTRTPSENDVLTWLTSDGRMITQSQHKILKALACEPTECAYPRLAQHHELVKQAMHFVREEEKNINSSLGKKTSIKHQVYMRLKDYCDKNTNALFVTNELKKAIDDIFQYPLTEAAREKISRQIKAGISDEDLTMLVSELRESEKLVIKIESEQINSEAQIICSLGLRNISQK